jgi:hypothetical protein
MDIETPSKLPWEAPATVALTSTDSRADQADVALRNGSLISPPG